MMKNFTSGTATLIHYSWPQDYCLPLLLQKVCSYYSLLLGNFVGCFQFLVTLVGFWLNSSDVIVSVTCSFDF